MVAVPIPPTVPPQPSRSLPAPSPAPTPIREEHDLTHWIAAGAVVAGGAMMVSGHRKAGLAVAVAGTALALIEEQEMVSELWSKLPGFLNQAQDFLDQVEKYLDEASAQGHRLQGILRR